MPKLEMKVKLSVEEAFNTLIEALEVEFEPHEHIEVKILIRKLMDLRDKLKLEKEK